MKPRDPKGQPDTRRDETQAAPGSEACLRVGELLVPYVDGEATGAERAELEAHVAACGDCARELALELHVREALESLGSIRSRALSDEEARSFVGAVRARGRAKARTRTMRALVAVAAVLLGGALTYLAIVPSAPVSREAPSEELLADLEILEQIQEEGLEPTPELVECILEIAASVSEDESEGDLVGLDVFEILLEEELSAERL